MEQANSFQYLGVIAEETGKQNLELNARIKKYYEHTIY